MCFRKKVEITLSKEALEELRKLLKECEINTSLERIADILERIGETKGVKDKK